MLEMNKKKIYIGARDVAENARLNFELDKWFWMPYRKGFALRGMTMLFLLACFPSPIYAEQCTPTPDCKSLGYTETSCPDGGGVKCPWNTSLVYCPQCKAKACEIKACEIGDILYSDKNCYTCAANIFPAYAQIGVVFSKQKAISLDENGFSDWDIARQICSHYEIDGVTNWGFPSESYLLAVYKNIALVQNGLQNAAKGKQLGSYWLWTTNESGWGSGESTQYRTVNPTTGELSRRVRSDSANFRCTLSF